MFDAFYDSQRFFYIKQFLDADKMFQHRGSCLIRKTASFHSKKMNIYIDTSDGVNEDLGILEYCARIKKIINECRGKPFLFFKAAYSKKYSKAIVELAEKNNGKVIPFFKWSFNQNFYNYLVPNRTTLIEKNNSADKLYDIGFYADLKPYDYPKPNESDPSVSWRDYRNFGIGSPKNTGDFWINSREKVLSNLDSGNFKLRHKVMPYDKYIEDFSTCKTVFNPPGIGEYTSRMFDATFLGKTIVLRKNSYDNGISWKNFIPEIDFSSDNWQNDYQKIIDNFTEWEEKSLFYFENYWAPKSVWNYFIENVKAEL